MISSIIFKIQIQGMMQNRRADRNFKIFKKIILLLKAKENNSSSKAKEK